MTFDETCQVGDLFRYCGSNETFGILVKIEPYGGFDFRSNFRIAWFDGVEGNFPSGCVVELIEEIR